MTLHMQHILQHLFQADTLEEVPRERLEVLVEEYPSFGIARYLLSSKLRAERADHFEEETRKTSLYFTNPFWLQWMLQQEAGEPPVGAAVPVVTAAASVATDIVEEPVEQPVAEHWVEEPKPEFPATEHWQEQEAEPAPWEEERHEEQPVTEQPVAASAVASEQEEQDFRRIEGSVAATVAAQQEAAAQPVAELGAAPNNPGEPPLVFESYHMIDYFASQGIKLAPDENPADRLGKQLKSFTEWLKVMKRLPQKETVTPSDMIAENRIQAIAAHSIEGREVVTETMAEVLAMQGMREKASEVYHKLSLLNPGKSGYFAEKIEQLKTN
jgi:hypothetical protein